MRRFGEERKADALKSVKIRLALQEIIKNEKIAVTDKDLEKSIETAAKRVGKEVEEYKKTLTDETLNYLRNEVLMDKLLEFLVEKNK